MTNLEFIKTLNDNDFVTFITDKTNWMCLQHGKYDTEIWKTHCLGPYKGTQYELGCKQCRIDWLNSEVGSVEKELEEKAIKYREAHGVRED